MLPDLSILVQHLLGHPKVDVVIYNTTVLSFHNRKIASLLKTKYTILLDVQRVELIGATAVLT
jgi:hypothetical protein